MRGRLLCLLLLGAVALGAPARAEPAYGGLNRALIDHVVVPAYRQMAAATTILSEATEDFCANPSRSGLAATVAAFHGAMEAWQRAQPIVFGPVTWDARDSRIHFWPDRGGTAARQIRRALQAQDDKLIAPGGLEGRSVALQSLSTYERLLFGRGAAIAAGDATREDRYACALAGAIARFQSQLAAEVLADWTGTDGFRDAVLTADTGNQHYLAAEEAASDFLKSLSGSLDRAIKLKLERPLGGSLELARPKRAETWRSARGFDNIVANLETARALYGTAGGFGDLLRAAGAAPLDQGLRDAFTRAIEALRGFERPLSQAVADPAARPRVEALLQDLKSLRLLVAGPLAEEIGLVVGFNALDGD